MLSENFHCGRIAPGATDHHLPLVRPMPPSAVPSIGVSPSIAAGVECPRSCMARSSAFTPESAENTFATKTTTRVAKVPVTPYVEVKGRALV